MTELLQQFSVSSVSIQKDTDVYLNVIKRRENVTYNANLDVTGSNISFVSSSSINANDNLSIVDRSTSLVINRDTVSNYTSISGTKTFTIETDSFVVTDIFLPVTNTIADLPLFLKHTLRNFTVGDKLISVEILDASLAPMGITEFSLDETNGIVYNNLETNWVSESNYTIYMVKYTLSSGGVVKTFYELLSNERIYTEATFDDLSETLEIIQDGRKVYLIDEESDGFTVTLPIIGDYAFKPISAGRIKVLSPGTTGANDNWFVRVTNGKFFTNLNGTQYKYDIAEYLSQTFNPEPPIKRSSDETSMVLDKHLIKLDRSNILEDTDLGLYITIELEDKDGNAKAAFTNDPALTGETAKNGLLYQTWSQATRSGIKSFDTNTGIVEIEGVNLKTSWRVTSDYYYKEKNYELTAINLNPISNSLIVNNRASVFMIPNDGIVSQTVFYLIADQEGRVIESNHPDFDNSTLEWDGKILYYDGLPSFRQTTVPANPGYIDPANLLIFTEDLSVASVAGNLFNYLILADLFVSNSIGIEQVTTFDSRKQGGGIIENKFEEAAAIDPEVDWTWDNGNWDGLPYPGNSSFMIEVPVTSMQGTGGKFTGQEITDIVRRHAAAGTYPVIRATGADITITEVTVNGDSITIDWTGHEYEV